MKIQRAENVCGGGINNLSIRQKTSSKFFNPIYILIVSFALAVSGFACGGSEKEDEPVQESDAGIVVTDGGTVETDAGVIENDSGIIEDNDASIIEDDAGTGDEPPEFISIPAGSFTLSYATGSHSSGDSVTLSAFELKRTPITVAEFEKCVAANACTSEHYRTVSDIDYCNYNRGEDWKTHPMNCVNFYGAKEYCEWIGARLPTEEEWEYAATHNGTEHLNTTYPWGDDAPTHCVTAQYYDSTTEKYCQGNAAAPMTNDEYDGTSDVSLHSPAGDSPLHLVDMSRNVWEWTASLYSSSNSDYIVKGGSWYNNEYKMSVTVRNYYYPSNRSNIAGVRCAK